MISYSELRRGTVIDLDGEPWQVLEYQHTKVQQRTPTLALKLRNLKTGRTVDRNLAGNQKLKLAEVEQRQVQYLYRDAETHYFMDLETFDQYPLTETQLGNARNYLKEQLTLQVVVYQGSPITVELPTSVDLKVKDSPPWIRGDTAQGGSKPATLETGLTIQVPLFVHEGDLVKVDTRTAEYLERVS